MRLDPIIVSGIARHQARMAKWFGRRRPRDEPDEPSDPEFSNADGRPNTAPAVTGYACIYDQPFSKGGRLLSFYYGCFGGAIYDQSVDRQLLLDHDDRRVVGATNSGLEFANNLEGLVYRLPLTGNAKAGEIKSFVESGRKACASVGCRILEEEQIEIDGVMVASIKRAELHEVSLVYQGAVDGTSASIVDLRVEEPDLRQSSRRPAFSTNAKHSNAVSRLARLTDRMERLSAEAERQKNVVAKLPERPVYTVNQLNRWQTEETERLQERANQISH